MDLPLQGPSCLPLLPAPDTPTLNPDPEALLDFASRVVGQASVQPIITHLGMEQGKQPPLAPGCLPPGLLPLQLRTLLSLPPHFPIHLFPSLRCFFSISISPLLLG